MGRIVKCKYRLEAEENNRAGFRQVWRGRATEKRLLEWIGSYHKSLQTGGTNVHLSQKIGFIPFLRAAKIVEQETGSVVAAWKAPMFMAF